ncbi:MAG: RDD family protein [Clostridiaceae bacterium]|nr:RDD family protein [Clostridiaceae bacterium]
MIDAPYIRRFFALLFDVIISVSLFMGIAMFIRRMLLPFPIEEFFAFNDEALLRVYLYFAAFYFVYVFLFSALLSSSPGKILVNIDEEYYRGHSFLNLFLRSLIKTITVLLGPVMMMVSLVVALMGKSHHTLHDLAARTRVTEETRSARLIGLFFIAAAVALIFIFYDHYMRNLVFDFSSIPLPSLY